MNHQSTAALTTRAIFGLPGDTDPRPGHAPSDAASSLLARLEPGHIALITGPSGAGKSSLAHAITIAARAHNLPIITDTHPARTSPPDAAVVDLLRGPLHHRLCLLASVGLADARLFVRSAHLLSVGERARLSIALALDAAANLQRHTPTSTPTIILDELASTLDRPTAASLARLLRRHVSRLATTRSAVRLICLTAHDDLAPHLRPDHHLRLNHAPRSAAPIAPAPRSIAPSLPHPTIKPGSYADYAALAHHHYRAGRPAILAGPHAIRRAIDPDTGDLVGVLVIAMPTLNAAWRAVAWPGRYRTRNKAADAARIARELRCIARVIVLPSHRGLGIAAALVRHYLAAPLTPATEALAAMGIASPFFEAAGMTPYRLPPTPRDSRLLDCLTHLDLTPASLLRPHPALQHPLLLRELRAWAHASRATRHLIDDTHAATTRAAESLLAKPIAYAHVARNFQHSSENTHAARRAA